MNASTFLEQFSSQYGWRTAPAKRRFRYRKDINKGMVESHRLALTMRGVIDRALDDLEGLQASDYSAYQVFEQGDLVFKLIDLENIKTSRVGLVPRRGIMSPAYIRLAPNHSETNSRFYAWLFFAAYVNNIFNGMGGGVRQNLTPTDLLEFPIPIPDLATQRRIADFLDRETARIDLLIEKKLRLVALLGEQRAAAISSAVTVGLHSSAELERTNFRYIPRVPRNWRVWRLKHIADIRGGLTLGRQVPQGTETITVPYMRVANVQAGWLDLSSVAEIHVTESEINRYKLKYGDVLMNEGGDNDKLGRGAVWHSEIESCVHQNHVFAVRPYDTRYSKWISLATNARYARDYFFLHSNQSTNLASISKTNLSRFPIALPPLDDMHETLELLVERIDKLDAIRLKTERSVDRLREYRSALITAAVTGQISVANFHRGGTADRQLEQIQEEMSE